MSEDILIVVLTLAPVFVTISLLTYLIINKTRLNALRPIFDVLLAPGWIVHETSHYIMCRLLGVKVKKVHLLTSVEIEEVKNSFLKPFLVGIAPSLINTIFACLLILVAPYFSDGWAGLLLDWLVVSIILGCGPSRADLANALRPIVKYPRSTLKELLFVAIGILCGLSLYKVCLLTVGVDIPPLLVAIFSFITTAILCALYSNV
jgi:uncharacterized membrane protein YqjE